jgi:hypothetical protein
VRIAQATSDAAVGDHKQGWNFLHAKTLYEVWALVGIDSLQLERVVISSPLQNLREEPHVSS